MTDEFVLNLDDYATRCLINSSFLNLYREKGSDLTLHGNHNVSSRYIDYPPKGYKCFTYESIGSGFEIVIVYPGSVITLEEMLDHILKNNGFALSKDNLFMLPEILAFQDYLLSVSSDKNCDSKIIAPAHKDNLINNQYLFYPCLQFGEQKYQFYGDVSNNNFHKKVFLMYSAARVDMDPYPHKLRFAYFRKK